MPTGAVNVEQASAWDGGEGDHWTEHEERYDAAVRRHGLRLRRAAQISADDHVLDIGCGCGESTRDAARVAVSGTALGVDLSARMIERARERSRAEGLTNTRFEQADAQVYPFDAQAFVYLGSDGDDAFGFVRGIGMTQRMLDGLDDTARARALQELRTPLAPHDTGEGVLLDSCAWLITARRS